jgi:hypothetical protein
MMSVASSLDVYCKTPVITNVKFPNISLKLYNNIPLDMGFSFLAVLGLVFLIDSSYFISSSNSYL